MKAIRWTVKDIVNILKTRQINQFDGNVVVSGDRGNGKSTIIDKICLRFGKFNQEKNQVYSREDVMNLLANRKFSICWDDEAVNSGYKRDFQIRGQKDYIKILTAYRDNFNILFSAIPNFFSLDKDLRDLMFLHLHVIERGIAVVHMPIQGRLYSQDRWDSKYNAKIEERWSKSIKKNPNFKPPYHKLSTFQGYLFFTDLTPKQRERYLDVKARKRKNAFQVEETDAEEGFYPKLYNQLIDRKLTQEGLMQIALMNDKNYSAVCSSLNRMLKDKGVIETAGYFLNPLPDANIHNSVDGQIKQIIPDL